MIVRALAALVATVLLSVLPTVAPVAHAEPTPCADQLAQLRGDVSTAPILDGKVDKERAGLLRLVDAATSLASSGKTGDALVKLSDLQTKVDNLASAGRIDDATASLLTGDISSASSCLVTV